MPKKTENRILTFSALLLAVHIFFGSDHALAEDDKKINQILRLAAEKYSSNLPQKLDRYTLLTSVMAGGNRDMLYKYRIQPPKSLDLAKRIREAASRQHRNNYCTNGDLSFYRRENIAMRHQYSDPSGNVLFSVTVDVSDC